MTIRAEIQSLSPSAMMEFFILDSTNLPGGVITRFHAGTNGLQQPVVWQGQTYEPMPIEASGFDVTAKGALPRPKLKVANVNGLLSASIKAYGDFVGCKITRKRTFAKYLDVINFPARRNVLAYTENFQHATWQQNPTLAVTPDAMTAPDGTLTADTTSSITGTRYQTVNVASGQVYTYSKHVLPFDLRKEVRLFMDFGVSGAAGQAYVDFVPLGNAITGKSPLVQSHGLIALPNGWYRMWMTFAAPASTTGNVHLYPRNADLHGWWGAQLEMGTLTDYQPVTGATYSANPSADPNQFIADDLWYVERKLSENRYIVEFELSSAFDLMGQMLPNRQVLQNSCPWRYRGTECGYGGTSYFDINNQPTTQANDICAKTLDACKKRFVNQPIRFGGFPGAVRGNT